MNITEYFISYMRKGNESIECVTSERRLLIKEMKVEVNF